MKERDGNTGSIMATLRKSPKTSELSEHTVVLQLTVRIKKAGKCVYAQGQEQG